jgi:hypothetical protein
MLKFPINLRQLIQQFTPVPLTDPSKSATGAFAASAVKGLRCAPMNSANYKIVRSAPDFLLAAA